jgi:WD40 repeat protein
MDLCWSSCDKYLVSAGNDNRVILWDVEKHQYIYCLSGQHKAYVLGVAFDPLLNYIISFGLDRRACVWKKC